MQTFVDRVLGTIWAGPTQRTDTAADAKVVEQCQGISGAGMRAQTSVGHGLVGEGTLVLSEAGARVDLHPHHLAEVCLNESWHQAVNPDVFWCQLH